MGIFDLFKKDKINTAPENDVERWILGTYAMWSVYYDGEWKYIAGVKNITKKDRASMNLFLRRDWGITNKESLFGMVDMLVQFYEEDVAGWDLCRACQILGMGFIAEMITREEMLQQSIWVCHQMQDLFSSWDELYESYLDGYRDWRTGIGEGAEDDIYKREAICSRLKEEADGPFTMPWQQQF